MKTKIQIGIVWLQLLMVCASCSSPRRVSSFEIYNDASEMVAAARAVVDEITVDEFRNLISDDGRYYLIDVRSSDEFGEGFIPGALSVPRGVLEFTMFNDEFWESNEMPVPAKNDTIVVYCRSGNRSVLAAKTLLQLGFTHVKSLEGGWKEWNGEGQ